jgi:hypothetical protein
MQIVEYVPISLQEKWTEAWNVANQLRRSATSEKDKERALKWLLMLPHGLLHAPTRGRSNRTRQCKEMARRFVLWMQRDMEGLIKLWRHATAKAHNLLTTRQVRTAKGERARIDRAMRLLGKGSISRAGKAQESKGLGDLRNPEVLQ